MVEVVGQPQHRPAQLVLDALECFQIVAAQRREERLDLGDALADFVEILVLHVDEKLFAADQHRLGAGHLIVEPVPELDQVDLPALRKEPRLEQVLTEVAEELAVVGVVELLIGKVASVPDAVANDVVAGAAELPERLVEDFERHLGERLRLGLDNGHTPEEYNSRHGRRRLLPKARPTLAHEIRDAYCAGTKIGSPVTLSTTDAHASTLPLPATTSTSTRPSTIGAVVIASSENWMTPRSPTVRSVLPMKCPAAS